MTPSPERPASPSPESSEAHRRARLLDDLAIPLYLLGALGAACAAGAIAFTSLALALAACASFVGAGAGVPARALARRGRLGAAAKVSASGLLVTSLAFAAALPLHAATSAMLAVVAVALALPYVEGRGLRALVGAAFVAATASLAVAQLAPAPAGHPTWAARAGAIASFAGAAFVALRLLLAWSGQIRDELARANELRRSDQLFKALFNQTFGFVVLLEPDGRVIEVNDALLAATGAERDEIVGRPLWDGPLFRGDPEACALLREDVAGATAGLRFRRESAYFGPGGARRVLDRSVGSLVDEDGTVRLLVLEGRDVTDRHAADEARRRAEAERERHAQELTRSNQELERFAYVASHDLQEPLRMVTSFAQLLARKYRGRIDGDADRYIAHVTDGVARMQRLINDLLAYSRVGRRERPFTPVALDEVWKRARADLGPAIAEAGATVTADPLPEVFGDAGLIEQVFVNLVGNALKFRGERPVRVHVSARPGPEEHEIAVSDNGIGIEPQFFDRIFVIFQRLHGPTQYSGTGIGLALCKKIVERHGGRLWVESTPGEGATFRFTLPAQRSAAAAPA